MRARPHGRRPAGYSGKPIAAKLGLKEGLRIALLGEPAHYRSLLGRMPAGTEMVGPRAAGLDFVHLFVTSRKVLEREFPRAKRRMKPDGALWVSWPKQTSPLRGEVTEGVVRDVGLSEGLVDVKVCAVDENWSALKFVYRLKDRASKAGLP